MGKRVYEENLGKKTYETISLTFAAVDFNLAPPTSRQAFKIGKPHLPR